MEAHWEWTSEEIKRIGYKAVDLIAEHLTHLPEQPVFRPFPEDLAASFLRTPAPRTGTSADAILAQFADQIAPYPFGNGHPHFAAWVNSAPVILGIFAEALAAAMNPSVAGGNHAAVYVEHQVINWFKELLGYSHTAGGLLVSGGSMATLTGLAVARHIKAGINVRTEGLRAMPTDFTMYLGQEGHSCIQKSVELLGLGSNSMRFIASDSDFRMDVAKLEAAIRADVTAGFRPLAVVASAGTVNTGAIDPVAAIADVCRRYDAWLHIDGAYGAPAILTDLSLAQTNAHVCRCQEGA